MKSELMLVAGPVRAWRSWSGAESINGEVFLHSLGRHSAGQWRWPLTSVMAAFCGHQLATTIDPECSCGLYATLTMPNLRSALGGGPPNVFTGQVELWGSVARYEEGYRAQYGRILEPIYTFFTTPDSAGAIQLVSSVAVTLPLHRLDPEWAGEGEGWKQRVYHPMPSRSRVHVSIEQAREAVRNPKVIAVARQALADKAKKRRLRIRSFYATVGVREDAAEVAPGVSVVQSAVTSSMPWLRAVLENPVDPAAKQQRLYWNPIHNRWLRGNMR